MTRFEANHILEDIRAIENLTEQNQAELRLALGLLAKWVRERVKDE